MSPKNKSHEIKRVKRKKTLRNKIKHITKIKERILNILAIAKDGLTIKEIFSILKAYKHPEREKIIETLVQLVQQKIIKKTENQIYALNFLPMEELIGTVDMVSSRYAYVICENNEEDIWIDFKNLNGALDGDKVRVLVYARVNKKDKRKEGEILEILERKRDHFVGKIELSPRFAFVIPDSKKMFYDIFVPLGKTKNAMNGQKVVVKITKWPENGRNPEGEVVDILGFSGENEVEMHAILLEYGLPHKFPEEVIKVSEKLSCEITEKEIKKRRDFRGIPTFTIDPEDAKDFDDALSIRKLDNGNYEVGIHIADVSHFVQPGSILDKEAFKRATSVYLVDRVVPMLPEKLSNDICSLKPNEDRLTFSAVFELTENAEIVSEWFGKTIIHSIRRFTYEEAQQIIESKQGDLANELNLLNNLALKLRTERFKKGSIAFETIEVKFKLDSSGRPLSVYQKVRKDAHKLIEDFMLLANKRVAEFVYRLKEQEPLTMVYRVHEKPDPDKIEALGVFARKFGYQFELNDNEKIAYTLNKLAEDTEGKPEQNVIQNLAIRAMAKARYTTQPISHFGLAFSHYTHFTSPIRRYPDLMVHRLLYRYLSNPIPENKGEYEQRCKHASEMEKLAAEAERASIKYKQVEFMQDLHNKVFEGIVSGVTDWGLYVEIIETKCEGLIKVTDLNDDFYDFDKKNLRLVGRRKGKCFTYGDKLCVRVKSTDLEKRTIDLELVKSL